MATARRDNTVRLLGVAGRNRPALLMSTALQASAWLVLALPVHAQPAANARPTGGTVVAGSAAIGSTGSNTQITQSSQRAAINWQSFDIGSQQRVTFSQPSASAVALNRVTGPDPSQIAGRIDANGQIILVNQSGVNFYKGAQVNTAGLVVTTANVTDANFMAGAMAFNRPGKPNAKIDNQGSITIKQAGLAALVAPQVANSGTISAKLGHVILAGAQTATLDLYGDGLLSLDVSNAVTQAPLDTSGRKATVLVTNTGVIVADGGTVQLTARAADGIVQNLVQAGGTIQAATMGGHTGTVALNGVGGSIVVEGQLSAPGDTPGSTGGAIVANATGNVTLTPTAKLNASGKAGGGGVAVGTTLARAAGGPSVTSTQTATNVTVAAGATIAADATGAGNGGRVAVLSAKATAMNGAISARGGPTGGDGGFVETSGPSLTIGATATANAGARSTTGKPGTWLLDPFDIDITAADLNTGSTTSAGTTTFTASANSGTVANTTVAAALGSNNVVVSTTGGGSQQGNITVSSAINWATANTLTLRADNNILIGNTITGTSGDLTLSAGITTTTGSITIGNPISVGVFSATAGSAGTINLASAGTAVTTGGGGQTYGSPAVLQQNTALAETGNGMIGFTRTVNATTPGAQGLTVNAGTGAVTFGGAVGGSKALADLLLAGTGRTTLDGNVTTAGAQSYGGPMTLGASATLTTTNAALALLGQVTGGTFSLTLSTGTGAQTLSGITTSGNLTLNTTVPVTLDSGTYTIAGGGSPYVFPAVTTNGTLAFGQNTDFGAVTLGSGTAIDSSGVNGALEFTGTVNATTPGGQGLTVNAGTGAVTFAGAAGGSKALANLMLTGTGPTTLDGNVTTTGAQSYGGPVTLGASNTLTTTNNAVDFAAAVDATTPGGQGLTVNAGTAAVTFGGAVGGSKALANLMLTGSGPATLDGNVTTTGVQSYGGPVTLGATDTLATTNAALALLGQVTGGTFSLTLSTGTGAQTLSGITTSGNLTLNTSVPVTLDGGTYAIAGGGSPFVFPAVTTNGTLTFGQKTNFGAVTLGSGTAIDSNGVNGALDFTGTVNATTPGAQGLTVNAGTGAVTFGGAVGGSKALADLLLAGTGRTTLDGNVTTAGAQSYGGPMTLGASATLTTTNAALALLGQVTGGTFSLTLSTGTGAQTLSGITTSGNLTLNTTVPVTLDSGTYTIAGGGSPYVFPAVTTNGTLAFGQNTDFGAVTLGSGTAIDSSGVNGALEFTGTVNATTPGGQGLTVNAGTGAVTFAGAAGGSKALANLMLTGTGPTTLDGNVTTTGAQSYGGPVTLGASNTLTTTNNAVDFAAAVDATTPGGQGLTVNAGTAAVTFGGAVGGSKALANLMLTGSGPATLDGNVTTTGVQSYGGAVTLGNAIALATTNNAAAFASTVDAATTGVQSLTVNAGTGAVTFGGAVGGSKALANLMLTGTGPTTLDGNVTTTGAQSYGGSVTLGATDTLTTTNNAVDFAAAVDATTTGVQGLTVSAGTGAVTFGGGVGGSKALANLMLTGAGPTTLDGDVTTIGAQSYGGTVTLGAADTLTTTNSPVHFLGAVDAATAGGEGLTVNAGTGVVTFGSTVGVSQALTNLTVTGTGPIALDGNVTTTGAQSYAGAVTLGSTIALATTNNTVDFASTVDATTTGIQGLTVNAGTGAVTFGSTVGGSKALAKLLVTGTGPTALDSNVTTTGSQSYGGAVTLGATDTLTTTNDAVDFAGTVDATATGVQGLTVNAGTGPVTFGSTVGVSQALANLMVTGAGPTTLDGDVTTTGAQGYGGTVTLGATDALTTTNGTVQFLSAVNAATAGVQGLTVNAGTGAVTLGSTVGASQALANLSVSGTGPTTLDGNVTTTGAQDYGGAVRLGANATLTTTNSMVDFAGTVDATTTGGQGLTVNAGTGAVTFGGSVGGSKALANLLVTGTGPTALGGSVTTSGVQSYGGAVTLAANDSLTTANSAVDFASTVDAATAGVQGLTVSAGTGAVTFGSTVGALRALANLMVTGTGPTTLDGSVTTTGAQSYGGAVTLGATDTLTTTNGPVHFIGTVDAATAGAQGLTVSAGIGAVSFGGTVGGSQALASLMVTGAGPATLGGNVITSGDQSYGGAVTLGATDILATTNSAVDFASTVDATTAGGQGLTMSAGTGRVTFGGPVGGSRALADLLVTGTGPTTLDGNVTTTGAQSYGGAVTLGATDILATANHAVGFVSTVNAATAGVQGLTVSAGTGAVTFGSTVGASQALANLTVTGTGPVTLDGSVTTAGAQSYGGAVTLGATDTLTTTNSLVRFLGTVDAATAGVQGLTVSAGTGAVSFGGAVGAASALANLSATGAAITLGGNVTATGALTLDSTGANSTLAINTALSADQVALTASDIGITGTVSGATRVTLTATAGITGTGSVSTTLLTGSAAISALLTGSNQVLTLGNFTATAGFALTDTLNLAVTGAVNGGSSVMITDAGALSIPGSVTGTTVNLTGSSISIPGMVSGPASVTLTANSGGITETGSVSTALLTGSAATSAGLTQPGNRVATLGAFSTSSGFALTDNEALVVAGPVTDTGAASTLALTTGTGGMTLAGTVSASNVVDLISAGAISQTGGTLTAGTLTGSAATSASLTQQGNRIANLSNFAASGLSLTDGADLTIGGNVNGGPSVTLVGTGSITIAAGGAVSGSAVTTTATGNVDIAGAVQGSNSLALASDTGSIAETGTLTTALLTGSAAGDASMTGTASSNNVVQLASFASGGTLTLVDGVALTITGPLTAPTIVINTGANTVTLADRAVITTGGTPRPPGTVTTFPGDTPATTTSGAFLTTAGGFIQHGTSTILGSNGPSVLRINAIGGANIAFDKTAGLQGTNTWLILDIGSGKATGQITVKDLDVIQTGQGGSAGLTGTVTGLTGSAAAGAAGIQPVPNSNFQINSCPIHSVSCVLLPTLSVPVQNPLNDIDIGSLFNPNEDQDLLLPIVSDQDY